jgi:hypothetical protein
MPKQTKWTSIQEDKLNALKTKVDLYERALKKVTKHAYKAIVMTTANQALDKAKELLP